MEGGALPALWVDSVLNGLPGQRSASAMPELPKEIASTR